MIFCDCLSNYVDDRIISQSERHHACCIMCLYLLNSMYYVVELNFTCIMCDMLYVVIIIYQIVVSCIPHLMGLQLHTWDSLKVLSYVSYAILSSHDDLREGQGVVFW